MMRRRLTGLRPLFALAGILAILATPALGQSRLDGSTTSAQAACLTAAKPGPLACASLVGRALRSHFDAYTKRRRRPTGDGADVTPPTPPGPLTVTSSTASSVSLSWSPATDNVGVTGYAVTVNGAPAGTTSTTAYYVGALTCGTVFTFAVTASDAAGNTSTPSTLMASTAPCVTGDVTPPTAPTGLTETASTPTSVTIAWSASTDNVAVAGYSVSLDGAQVAATFLTGYTVTGLTCASTHLVGVEAYDAAGNRSALSSLLVVTSPCLDTSPPSTPTNLAVTATGQTSISVAWSASSDNVGVAGYTVYLNGSSRTTTAATSATVANLTCGSTYTIAVDAYDTAGNHSGTASVSTATSACTVLDSTPPSTPTNLAQTGSTSTTLTVSWTASTDNVGVTGYRLFQNGNQIGTSAATTYQFTGLSCATSYTLGVAAVDAAGNVSGTATMSAATSSCAGSSSAASIYVAQSTAGTGDGSSCANAKPASFFNTASNWGTGKPIAPGTTVGLCGTITSTLSFQGSGTSGHPITVQFQPGAKISRPTCDCFDASNQSYIVIDGGSNGVIEATNDGVNLGLQQATRAIDLANCQTCTVENLTISNIFVMTPSSSDPIDHTQSNAIYADGANLSVHDNVIHDVGWAIYDNNGTNSRIYNNDISHMDHGITLSGDGAGPVLIYGNHIHDMANWDCGGGCHHDGIHCYTVNGGQPNHYGGGIYIYDNRFDGTVGTDNTSFLFLESGSGSSGTPCADATSPVYVFNNYAHPSDYPTNNGIFTPTTGRLFAYDNTLVGLSNTNTGGYAWDLCGGSYSFGGSYCGPGAFENNVSATVNNFGGWVTSLFSPLDYDVYADASGSGSLRWWCDGTDTNSFTTFQALCGEGHGTYTTGAPGLSSTGVPQAGSPVLNAGANLTPLCTGFLVPLCSDITGHPRPQTGPWDAGAYEVSQ
jgi:chitodextrinase